MTAASLRDYFCFGFTWVYTVRTKPQKETKGYNMTAPTENIIKAALAADQTVTPEEARAVIDTLKGKGIAAVLPNDETDMVLSRKQVAALIGKSEKAVDIYGRQGIFKRVYLRGAKKPGARRVQASGYSRKSVVEAMRTGATLAVCDNGYGKRDGKDKDKKDAEA